jgi:oligopeptide/dipeptide ABC transporter ATP-binding protein
VDVTGTAGPVLEVSLLTTEIATAIGVLRPVSDVSFSVHAGETLCLVGESGSGKSMLGLSIMRVLPRTAQIVSGSVRLQGRELIALPEEEMRAVRGGVVAMVPQDPMTAFDPLYTIGDQIAEAIRVHRSPARNSARQQTLEVLEQVGLPDPPRIAASLPSQLSGGMNQRALIAMALATDPVLLIADEPTTALDVTVQAQVLELLLELRRARGLAILLVTHDMGVAAMVADRIAVMYAGRLVEVGSTGSLFSEPRHPYTVGLIEAAHESTAADGRFHSIPGAPPNLLALAPGCAFASRCAYARERCRAAVPDLRDFGGLRAACVLEDDERPWIGSYERANARA